MCTPNDPEVNKNYSTRISFLSRSKLPVNQGTPVCVGN